MIKKKYIISTDLGSQSIKTIIYDMQCNLVASFVQENKIHRISKDSLIYDGKESLKKVIFNIKRVLELSKIDSLDIESLSFTGMGAGIIGVDKDWVPTTEFLTPIDKRSDKYLIEIINNFGVALRNISGIDNPAGVNNIIWLKKEFPEKYKKTTKFMPLTHFVQGKFCDIKIDDSFWENTSPQFSGLYDSQKNCWSEDIFNELRIDINKMPSLVRPYKVIGKISKEIANECDLVSGIPVSAGAFDKVCDFLGAGCLGPGSILDIAATYPALLVGVKEFTSDQIYKTLLCHRSAIDDLWIAHTYIIGGGLTHNWFREVFYDQSSSIDLKVLDNQASRILPGSEGIIFIPHLSGRATPNDPFVKGAWIGFSWNHDKVNFYRSILESFAFESYCSLEVVKSNFPNIEFTNLNLVGGGAISDFWNQLKADVLNLCCQRLNRNDTTTLGSMLIALKAIDPSYSITEELHKYIFPAKIYNPNKATHEQYKEYINIYSELLIKLKPIFKRLASVSDFSRDNIK